jgi:ABC-type sugar transport system substrate-binding protein
MITRRTARSANVFAALVASAALMAGAAAPASASTGFSFDFMGGYTLFISFTGIVILPPSG